jgi:hypothetical protein
MVLWLSQMPNSKKGFNVHLYLIGNSATNPVTSVYGSVRHCTSPESQVPLLCS